MNNSNIISNIQHNRLTPKRLAEYRKAFNESCDYSNEQELLSHIAALEKEIASFDEMLFVHTVTLVKEIGKLQEQRNSTIGELQAKLREIKPS